MHSKKRPVFYYYCTVLHLSILLSRCRTSLWSPCGSSYTSPLLLRLISLLLPIARQNCAFSPSLTPLPKETWTRPEGSHQAASPLITRAANLTTTLCQGRSSPIGTFPRWIGPRAHRTQTKWQTKVGRTVSALPEPPARECRTSMIWKKQLFRGGRPTSGHWCTRFLLFLPGYLWNAMFIQWYTMPLLGRRWQ